MPNAVPRINPTLDFYDHQRDGVKWMVENDSFILGDPPGLGKTLMSLATIAFDYSKDWARRTLVVCPSSIKDNWALEIGKLTDFSCAVLDGTPKRRRSQLEEFEANDTEILIVNYEQIAAHMATFERLGFDVIIFDEAHYLKNPEAKRTRSSMRLGFQIGRRMMLTGTPLLGNFTDMWSLLHLCNPNGFADPEAFRARYAIMGGFGNTQVMGVQPNREDELLGRVNIHMLRREKDDVLDLPEKQYIKLWVPLSKTQQRLYNQAEAEMMIDLPSHPDPVQLENALARFTRLKQICSTPSNLDDMLADDSLKLDLVVERAMEVVANGEPVIIFTQFRNTNEAIATRIETMATRTGSLVPVHRLHGGVKKNKRQDVVEAWRADAKAGKCPVMVAQISVAGVGLTMTEASTVVFAEKTFTPALNEQAVDRVHRIGAQGDRVQIVEVMCLGTIEERVEQILSTKAAEFNKIVVQGDAAFKQALYDALREEFKP